MYGLQEFTNIRTKEKIRALISNNDPQAQADLMLVKEREARTAEGDLLVAGDGREYFALQHDFGGLTGRPAVRSYRLVIAPINDHLTIYRLCQGSVDRFGRLVSDSLQIVAENLKAIVESKVHLTQKATPAYQVQTKIRRVLCGPCMVEEGDLVALNDSAELSRIVAVDDNTWGGRLLVLTVATISGC